MQLSVIAAVEDNTDWYVDDRVEADLVSRLIPRAAADKQVPSEVERIATPRLGDCQTRLPVRLTVATRRRRRRAARVAQARHRPPLDPHTRHAQQPAGALHLYSGHGGLAAPHVPGGDDELLADGRRLPNIAFELWSLP